MPNCEIYFPIFSETIRSNLKIFSQDGSVDGSDEMQVEVAVKNRVLEFLAKIFVQVAKKPGKKILAKKFNTQLFMQ